MNIISKSGEIDIAFTIIIAFIISSNSILYYPYRTYAQQGSDNDSALNITQGVASGDVTDHSAIIWARANGDAQMHVQYYDNNLPLSSISNSSNIATSPVNQTTDFTGHIKLDGLKPDTPYHYRVWFSSLSPDGNIDNKNQTIKSDLQTGNFTTAPSSNESSGRPIRFVIGGDLGGSMYCRRPDIGYSIFSVMKSLSPDFFIFNGDQIYADFPCPAEGPNPTDIAQHRKPLYPSWHNIPGNFLDISQVNWTHINDLHSNFLKHWEYNRNDSHLQGLLRNTSMYSQLDDHEVLNDYGGNWTYYKDPNTKGFQNVVKEGVNAFFNFSPIERNSNEHNRIYRSFHWGKDLDLFILDARSYRSRNDYPDTLQFNKTLLGKEQLHWLEQGLLNSKATWKVISTDVPITIPSCFRSSFSINNGCDNWATSYNNNKTFVRERSEFLNFLDNHNIKNVIFLATDVHFAANVKVDEDPNHDGNRLLFYELANGPLSTFAKNTTNPLDPTLHANYLYNESAIFNFGYVIINKTSGNTHFIYHVVDTDGRIRPKSDLDITSQQ